MNKGQSLRRQSTLKNTMDKDLNKSGKGDELELIKSPNMDVLEKANFWEVEVNSSTYNSVMSKDESKSTDLLTVSDVSDHSIDFSGFEVIEMQQQSKEQIAELRVMIEEMKDMIQYGVDITNEFSRSQPSSNVKRYSSQLRGQNAVTAGDEVSDVLADLKREGQSRYSLRSKARVNYKE